jgi:hypothetical protein
MDDEPHLPPRTDEPHRVAVTRVQGQVTSASTTRRRAEDAMTALAFDLEDILPEEWVTAIHRFRVPVAIVLVVGALTELFPQAPWLLIIPALIGLVLLRIDRRIRFGFAEGFIGYRSQLGWPRGVQEDDDVHWRWHRRATTPRA